MTEQQNMMLTQHITAVMERALQAHGMSMFEWAAAEKHFLETSERFKKRHQEDEAQNSEKFAALGVQ